MDRVLRVVRAVSLFVVSACAPTWSHAAMATQVAAVGALACDGGTTSQFLDAHAYYEGNSILGPTPSDARLWGYLGAIAIGVLIANRRLPPAWALAANVGVLGLEVRSVVHNMAIGSSFCGVGDGGPWR